MKATAEIVGHRVVNPLTGDYWTELEWVGPVHGIARVDRMFWDQAKAPSWSYEILQEDYWPREIYICRTDYPAPWPLACNRLQAEADRFARFWDGFQARLVYTAQVWGLAYVEPGRMPGWGCIGQKPPWGRNW